ncbi:RND transporter, partial [Desulfovibrio oxamicus]|nr:RND transporter [Nitratidesulfovibrio oxamicus]
MLPALLVPAVLVTFLMLSGCAVGPDYDRPAPPAAPTEWSAARARPEISGDVSGNGGGNAAARAAISAATPDGQWWERMGDPQLSELVAMAVGHNNDALIAAATLREARAV